MEERAQERREQRREIDLSAQGRRSDTARASGTGSGTYEIAAQHVGELSPRGSAPQKPKLVPDGVYILPRAPRERAHPDGRTCAQIHFEHLADVREIGGDEEVAVGVHPLGHACRDKSGARSQFDPSKISGGGGWEAAG